MAGCATNSDPNYDPLEPLNRDIFAFNQSVDKVFVRPIVYAYQKVTPNFMQRGVSNFFDNLRELPTIANDLLQIKPGYAVKDSTRFLINSTFGLAGFVDVASMLGVERHKEDFGQTLHNWGFKNSTYIVLPFFGPSTFRDTVGFAIDYSAFSVFPYLKKSERYWLLGGDYLDQRSRMSRHGKVLEAVGIDQYVLVRNAYLQHRRFISYDGQVPEEEIDDDFSLEEGDLDEALDNDLDDTEWDDIAPESESQINQPNLKSKNLINDVK